MGIRAQSGFKDLGFWGFEFLGAYSWVCRVLGFWGLLWFIGFFGFGVLGVKSFRVWGLGFRWVWRVRLIGFRGI